MKKVLGMTVYYEDGTVDINDAANFIAQAQEKLDRIKREVKPEYQEKEIEALRERVKFVVKDWAEKTAAQKAEIKNQLEAIQAENAKTNKRNRTLTHEEVSVLAYQANILKSKFNMVASSEQYQDFIRDLKESPEQVRQAFIDNVADILGTGSQYGFELERNDINEIVKEMELTFLSEEQRTAAEERAAKTKELEMQLFEIAMKEDARQKQLQDLKRKLVWNEYEVKEYDPLADKVEKETGPGTLYHAQMMAAQMAKTE